MRRPSLSDVRRTTDQFLRTALATRGIDSSEFSRLEAELAERKRSGTLPDLVRDRKDHFHTSDGLYRIAKSRQDLWTVSKLKDSSRFARVAEAKTRHLCWVLVQRLIVLDDRPS
ncbi:MAG TPA: hypothetical protein VFG68_00165 [Fimbriiglobus sp.]|nr:hypothetical protein [Fimbriiglobus sp.]